MSAGVGRNVVLTWDGNNLGGAREKSFTFNGEAIDISDDYSQGWRELLEHAGEYSINLSVSGVTRSDTLRAAWFAEDLQETMVVTFPGGDSFSGTFHLASYSETGNYKEAITYEAEFQSTGVVTYTPAP